MRGSWLPLGATHPLPYPLSRLADTWDYANRVERCARYSPSSFQFGWSQDNGRSTATPLLMDGDELCHRMHLTNALVIGDSISLQLFESWVARLRQAHANKRHGGCSIASPSPWSTCEGAAGELCAGLCAGGANRGEASKLSSCDNGATFLMAQAYRWVLDSSDFEASDERGASCAEGVRQNPRAWGLYVVPSAHVERMLTSAARRPEWSNKTAHPPSVAVLFNQFYHLHEFITGVASCYSASGIADAGPGTSVGKRPAGSAYAMATRDVLRFWSRDVTRWATLLETLAAKLRPAVDVQSYYVTSHQACDAYCDPPGAHHPINASAVFEATIMKGIGEYSHQWVHWVNDVSRAAFVARGHGVIDVEAMLSARVDAHPASHHDDGDLGAGESNKGKGDRVHFCAPGPLDWALDAIVRHVATHRGGGHGAGRR